MLDFIPVKGRSWQVYCKVCTPPDRAQGQPMTIAAAVRHERENAKHKEKLAEAALWDPAYEPQCDWTTPHVPKGESAWEYDYLSERVKAYVNFWMDGIATAARDETPMHMDVFIARYDKQYQEENWQEKYEDWADEEEEWPLEDFDGIPGHWYQGGSFYPWSDGYDLTGWEEELAMHSHTAESLARFATWWPEDPEPCAGWGFTPEEAAEWEKGAAAEAAAQRSQPSDATPQQSSEKTPSQRARRRRRNRGRGRGQGKQEGKEALVPDAATRRVEAHRDRRAKMY